MDIRQRIINFASKLIKEFPEENGGFAVVVITQASATFDEGFEGNPLADTRPQFVKDDEVGWERINVYKGKP
jgi:hypothetical protein